MFIKNLFKKINSKMLRLLFSYFMSKQELNKIDPLTKDKKTDDTKKTLLSSVFKFFLSWYKEMIKEFKNTWKEEKEDNL